MGLSLAGFVGMTARTRATPPHMDFGMFVESQLKGHSEQLFGFKGPLDESALGPYDGTDNLQAIKVAQGLHVSLVSSSVASAADQIASGQTMITRGFSSCATKRHPIPRFSAWTFKGAGQRTRRQS